MGESKQVKVDNWGIFFLQRLQHFFNKTYFCDLTLQFEDNAQLKVHRLVMNACTEYFQMLEQTCEIINDCVIMPPNLQADVVVPIVNFMYTGILEFQETIFDRLYTTARMMNMTVLTKLLDAQKVPISPIPKPINKRSPISPITWNLQGKRIAPKTMDPDFPEPLPGRKLPIWKRKSAPGTITYRANEKSSISDAMSTKYFKSNVDDTPKPTRFEWPDEDDNNSFDTSPFDEISYTSKPLIMPSREKSPKPSTSNFEELKRSSTSVKRPASPIYNDNKKMNIQDVKEYLKEQKLRSDYIDYDDAEAADNDLQTYDDDDSGEETADKDAIFDQNADDAPNKSILKNDASTPHNKRVRFSLEGKENAALKTAAKLGTTVPVKAGQSTVNMSNHTKIITEVLKKYPHLVKKNKNIRLKILAKGSNPNNAGLKPAGTPMKVVKPTSKVSYMVRKPEQNAGQATDKQDGHWSCQKCSNPNPLQFETYYLYRKHLTDVHNEKTDSQMCNICGHVSRKQNMLMYHKFVKHNITPPAMYQFPKCKECPYIALSPTLLTKHQFIHTHVNLVCAECGTSFQNKSQLICHVQLTGHTERANSQTYDCGYCSKKFISDDTLFQHIKKNHKSEARRDNIISSEEIDEMDDQEIASPQTSSTGEKPKEKIKILSDIKVNTPISTSGLIPVRSTTSMSPEKTPKVEETVIENTQPLVPSSEAESLSNVASGIAASLGLVNTIVVLDENQFILQSQEGVQENISGTGQTEFILPEVTNIENMPSLHVSQHQVLSGDNNTIISQATLNKNDITSTDELVMVLTDHDYSDASNNVITSENSNIVVLYSHPVQSQDGQFISQQSNLMLNSDISLMEVSNNYTVANTVTELKPCEESIEMIQQEINNHLDGEIPQEMTCEQDKVLEDQIITFTEIKSESVQVSVENLEKLPKETELLEGKMDVDPDEEHLEITKENQIKHDDVNKMLLASQTKINSEVVYPNNTAVLTENTANRELLQANTNVLTDHIKVLTDNAEVLRANTEVLTENTELLNDARELSTGVVTENTALLANNRDKTEMSVDNTELLSDNTGLSAENTESSTENTGILTENTELLTDNNEILTESLPTLIANSAVQKSIDEKSSNIELIPDITENLTEHTEPIVDTAGVLTHNTEIPDDTEMLAGSEMHQVNSDNQQDNNLSLLPENIENQFEEPMEVEESIEQIQNEINKSSPELSDVPPDTADNMKPIENSNQDKSIQENVNSPKQDKTNENKTLESDTEQPSSTPTETDTKNEDSINNKLNVTCPSFDEPMEVDSSKLQINNIKLIPQHVREDNNENPASVEIVPDSEEEKCAAEDEQLSRDEVDKEQLGEATSNQGEEINNQAVNINIQAVEINNQAVNINNEAVESNNQAVELNNQVVEINNQGVEKVLIAHDNQEIKPDIETSCVESENENLDNITENTQECIEENSETVVEQAEQVQNNELEETSNKDNKDVSRTEVEQVDNLINKYAQESKSPIIESAEKPILKSNKSNNTELLSQLTNTKISILLDDWDDGDTDSQQSEPLKPAATDTSNSINTLINDWEDEEDT